jgi:single-strand DNA-binding protein
MKCMNKTLLLGNVGMDPETKTTRSGTKIAKVSLATNEKWKDRDGEYQERTEWHRLTFFDKLAEIVEEYVSKGDPILVEGQLRYSTTEDDDGNTRYWTEIIVRQLHMLGSGNGKSSSSPSKPAPKKKKPLNEPDDDLPW